MKHFLERDPYKPSLSTVSGSGGVRWNILIHVDEKRPGIIGRRIFY